MTAFVVQLALVSQLAHAQVTPPTAELETIAQVRYDLFGEKMVPLTQYMNIVQRLGDVSIVANTAQVWDAGIENSSTTDLYTVEAEVRRPWIDATVGRTSALGHYRLVTFDGARALVRPAEGLQVSAWGGIARHHDLDDLRDGAPVGRIEARYGDGALHGRLGAQIDGAEDGPAIGRQDIEARVELLDRGYVSGKVVATQPTFAMEWARLEAAVRPVMPIEGSVHLQHREVVDLNSIFGDAILETLAGGEVDELGVGLRADGAKMTTFSMSWSGSRYERVDGDQYGHGIEASWLPTLPGAVFRWYPSYRFRAGPGGMFHAVYATTKVDLSDTTELMVRGAVVPFRKTHLPWMTALDVMSEVEQQLLPQVHLAVNADLATDRVALFDARVGMRLLVEVP